jgi:hypothetical protein
MKGLRKWVRAPGPVFVAACLLSWGILPALPAASQVVEGRVSNAESGEPVPGAAVELLTGQGAVQSRVSTDEEGSFVLRAPASGTYRIRAGRIGFQTVSTPSFDLVRDGEPLQVEVLLGVDAIPLAPLVVVSERSARVPHLRLHIRGFYERQRTWGKEGMGFGHFLGPDELERRILFYPSDAIRGVPGIRVVGAGGRRQELVSRGGRCPTPVFLDGVYIASGNMDEFVSASEIVGIEVYPGGTGPPEFVGPCGAIVIWTGLRP